MNLQYLPRQLTVISTNECTARCAHCTMCSEPGRKEKLTYSQIKDAIDKLNTVSKLLVVVFSGGEPTLLGEDLLDSIAYADSLGILTRIVTNAHWATSRAKAAEVLREFRDAGLAELNISTDDYHIPFVPFDNIENVWHECKDMGFSSVVIANSHGPNSRINPEFIMERLGERIHTRYDSTGKSQPYCPPAEDGTLYLLSNACLQKVGRAKAGLVSGNFKYPKDQNHLGVGCRWALRNPSLSPTNHLWACCGIECEHNYVLDMGDISAKDIEEVLYKANDDVIMNAIIVLGPLFLRNYVRSKCSDVQFKDSYATVCEICDDVVKNERAKEVLQDNFGDLVQYILRYGRNEIA